MKYNVCTNCPMDGSDPDITFDESGVCNHCIRVRPLLMNRIFEATERPWVVSQIKRDGRGKDYDCILGLSGGVDSSLALHYLVEQGLRPLTFSVDNGWNTKESDENIMRLVEGLKVPFFRYTIDLDKFKELQARFIESGTPNIEIPTDHILMAATYEMARKHKIKWIISGGNLATESVMPEAWGYNARDLNFIQSVNGGKVKGLPTMSIFQYIYARFVLGIKILNFLDYYDYNRANAIKLLQEKYGYKPYGEKHEENVFTKWFQNWYLPTKFGIDKRKAHFASMVLSGQMTRKEAMDALLEKPIYPQFGIESDVLVYPKRTHKDFKNSEKLWNFLTHTYARYKN